MPEFLPPSERLCEGNRQQCVPVYVSDGVIELAALVVFTGQQGLWALRQLRASGLVSRAPPIDAQLYTIDFLINKGMFGNLVEIIGIVWNVLAAPLDLALVLG